MQSTFTHLIYFLSSSYCGCSFFHYPYSITFCFLPPELSHFSKMPSHQLLRRGFLGMMGLLCLLLVHRVFHIADGSPSRNHARDLISSTAPLSWPTHNLTSSVPLSRSLAKRALTLDAAWRKGHGLFCKCKAKDQVDLASEWTNIEELDNYWEIITYGKPPGDEIDSAADYLR